MVPDSWRDLKYVVENQDYNKKSKEELERIESKGSLLEFKSDDENIDEKQFEHNKEGLAQKPANLFDI